jgi:hypothetical protein
MTGKLSPPVLAPPFPHTSGARLTCRRAALRALLACFCLTHPLVGEPALIELAVIVAPASSLANISMADLQRVFLSEAVNAPGGQRLVPINHPPRTPDRVGFDRVVLDREPDEVGRYWIDQRIRGGAGPPRSVDSVGLLRRVVANLPGAIGYVRPGSLSPEVRPVRVEGKLPGESGYPVAFQP